MNHEKSYDFVKSCGCDIEFASQRVKELDNIIDAEAEKRSIKKEEERFNAHKEEFQLEVLQQLQAEGIKKEGAELSSASPLISDTYIVDGVTLLPDEFIPDSLGKAGCRKTFGGMPLRRFTRG